MKQHETAKIMPPGGISAAVLDRDDGIRSHDGRYGRVPSRHPYAIGRDMVPWNSRMVVEIEPGFFR